MVIIRRRRISDCEVTFKSLFYSLLGPPALAVGIVGLSFGFIPVGLGIWLIILGVLGYLVGLITDSFNSFFFIFLGIIGTIIGIILFILEIPNKENSLIIMITLISVGFLICLPTIINLTKNRISSSKRIQKSKKDKQGLTEIEFLLTLDSKDAIEPFRTLLKHSNSARKMYILWELGRKNDPAYIELIKERLTDIDFNVRKRATEMLVKIENPVAISALEAQFHQETDMSTKRIMERAITLLKEKQENQEDSQETNSI
jgi:hypothetical protein